MEKPAILILDSDVLMRHRLLEALAPLEQPILSAGTLEEGKIMLNNNRIDVLLLDCPQKDESMEILSEITADFPFTRIIALIDMTAADVAVEADKRGVFSCLAKPFEPRQLLFLMEWALKDRGNRHCNHDELQGYYFSRPLPAEEMEQLLRQGSCLSLPRNQPADMKTILVVDDESQILTSMMSRLLRMRKDNLRVLTAANADEGFEQLALNKVDLVLSDMVMPGMNGLEFLGRVRGLYPDVTRIAMSGHADVDMVAESINQNAISKFLLKPVDMDRLSRVIDEACFPTGKEDE